MSNLSGSKRPILNSDLDSRTHLQAQRSNTQLHGKHFTGVDGNFSSLSTKKGVTFGAHSTLDSRTYI
jgi:hypothetical protein